MKILTFLISLSLSGLVFASDCSTDIAFSDGGWEVSRPQDFDLFYSTFKSELDSSINTGDAVKDLDGTIVTTQSLAGNRIYMRTQTWDNLKTSTGEMYGDVAIFTNKFAPEQVLEIRWYKDGIKNVAINEAYLTCVSLGVPLAENVVF